MFSSIKLNKTLIFNNKHLSNKKIKEQKHYTLKSSSPKESNKLGENYSNITELH